MMGSEVRVVDNYKHILKLGDRSWLRLSRTQRGCRRRPYRNGVPDDYVGYFYSINSGNGEAVKRIGKIIREYITRKLQKPPLPPVVSLPANGFVLLAIVSILVLCCRFSR